MWQQQPDDRCQHCGQLLDPRTHAEEAERQAAGPPPPTGLRWLQIQPDDGAAVRLLKIIGQGGQWLFAAVVGFSSGSLRWWPPSMRAFTVCATRCLWEPRCCTAASSWPATGCAGPTPWLTSYLADVLFLPLLLSVALALHRAWLGSSATLPVVWVLAAYVGVAVWFEGILPLYSARAVADPLDVLAYGVGAWVFLRWLNRPG
ncbi:MAG: hypothetical protein WKG07_43620 [Hymenobacter sp.]